MRSVLFLAFLFVSFTVLSQTFTVKGVVQDSLHNPLAYANVIAKPISDANTMKFAITNEEGQYKLDLDKDSYEITVSYLGFKSKAIEVTVDKDFAKNFILQEDENSLEEIVIEMPVMVKEDTIVYDTKRFVNGKERKLKNVLKKLPGVEVEKNGTVTVQGKKVTTMLVDGKPFFGGNTKLAVDNIPANAIDKIEAIDNYNKVGFLKNVSDSEEMAMNIKLKEDKKKFTFGDIEAGKGNKDFYRTHSNLFYYSPKTTLNFIGNLNNTGEKTFTFKDYLSFNGGISAVFKSGMSNFFKNNELSQFMESQDFLASQNKFAALNISKATSGKLDISGFGIFSHSKINTFSETNNQYTTFSEVKDNTQLSKNSLGIAKLSLDYTPSKTVQWDVSTQFKRTTNLKNRLLNTLVSSQNNSILTNQDANGIYVNQNIEGHKKVSKKHTFSFVADYTYDQNNPNTLWQSTAPILQGLIPLQTDIAYNLQQLKENRKHTFETMLKHYWVINNNNHLYTTLGNHYSRQQFNTNDSQLLSNGFESSFNNAGFNNNTHFRFNDIFLGLHYKFKTGIFTFKQGAYLRHYEWKIKQQQVTANKKTLLLPDFKLKIQFRKSKRLILKYNMNSAFNDVSQLANRFYLQSYNSVYKGNQTLANELYHTASIRYNRFSAYRALMLISSINYTKKDRGIKKTVNFQGANQFLTSEMLSNPEQRWNVLFGLRKKIKKIQYKLRLDYSTTQYLQKINSAFVTNTNNSTSVKIAAKTLFKDFPTLEIGYKQSLGNYKSSNRISKFTTKEPFLNIEYDFLKHFSFEFDYTFYNYANNNLNLNNTYKVSNALLYYKNEDSPWSYRLEAKNIFNSKFKQSNSFSSYIISDTKTFIQPVSVVFSVAYNL